MRSLKKIMKKKLFIIIPIILFLILFLLVLWFKAAWEGMRKMDCTCNIRHIIVCLHMYADRNDGWFPDKSGKAGLEMLRKGVWEEANLKNIPYLFNCPSVQPAKKHAISYDYIAGYRIDSENIGIVMDQLGNHKDFGNIGFVDGRVLSFTGKDWRKNANIAIKSEQN